jgi:transposase InsO family protein
MDFMHHRTRHGVTFRLCVVVDEFTRELLALRVARSFTTTNVLGVLADVFAEYGTPRVLRSDNGPEFISSAFQAAMRERSIAHELSRPGKPCDNGLCESTNGRIRDELLRPYIFDTIDSAADAAAFFRHDYNTVRPHSALDGLAPSVFHQRLSPPTFRVA